MKYWFAAKRYGWGWGLPVAWQGWVVLIAYIAMLVTGALLFPPRKTLVGYLVYVAVLGLLLGGICWLKGEPVRWKWKDDTHG